LAALVLGVTVSEARAVEIISISPGNRAGNGGSNGVIANTDGGFVAFYSDANDLVRGDTNQARDVFLRNRTIGTTTLISVNSDGEQANRPSHAQGDAPAINGDGTLVAFYSDATNLVANDVNSQTDVFVRDLDAATTEIVSLAADGTQGNGPSLNPSMDVSGNLVAFQSLASNLVPGDGNRASDIFVRDRAAGTIERICGEIEGNGASFAPAISADGNVVAFTSAATNLVSGDTNGKLDIFVCDRRTGEIEIISVSSSNILGNGDSILPAISADGRFVAYKSLANNLVPNDRNGVVDVFFRDRVQNLTERVSINVFGGDPNDGSYPPSISHDGRFVAFGSEANNLVHGDVNQVPSVFVRDMVNRLTLIVDLNDRGEQANGGTPDVPPAITGDGRQIAYISNASNLNAADLNQTIDAYIDRNPFVCDDENPCPPPLVCVDGYCVEPGGTRTPTPTLTGSPTPTTTAGPDDCCQCATEACEQPGSGGCPAECDIVRQAVCLDTTNCATFTPTPSPTPTHTASADDCCQCEAETCEDPSSSGCPAECDIVRQAVCLDTTKCATFTPTPSPSPTHTASADDCCQCSASACEQPGSSGCPAECDIVRDAVCLGTGTCATFTPTATMDGRTVTPTATRTPCVVGTPCPAGSFPTCTDPSDPCTCSGCGPCPEPTAACPGGARCIYQANNSCDCTCEAPPTATLTPRPEGTATPTATASVSPTQKKLDRDACVCALEPDAPLSTNGGLLWLSAVAGLFWRQRRRQVG